MISKDNSTSLIKQYFFYLEVLLSLGLLSGWLSGIAQYGLNPDSEVT